MHNRYKLSTILLLTLLILSPLCAQSEIAVIAKIVGTVTYHYKEQAEWLSLKPGTLLFDNATIRTASDGFATLIYLDDKSRVTIRPKSELTISGTQRREQIEKKVQMQYGESIFEVTKEKRRFKVATPTSVASVKGTKFFVVASKDTASTVIYGISGSVSVSGTTGPNPNDTASVIVSRMKKALVLRGGFAQLDTLTQEEFEQLLALIGDSENANWGIPITHKLTLQSGRGGSVHPEGEKYYPDNTPIAIHAYPEAPYSFIRWQTLSGRASLTNPFLKQTELTLNGSSVTLEAHFSTNSFPVLFSSSDGGSTVPDGEIRVEKDSLYPITALPEHGYQFKRWQTTGAATISDLSAANSTVRFSDSGSVRALFEKSEIATEKSDTLPKDSLHCIVTADGKGSVSPEGTISLLSGEKITLSAKPKRGYLFSHWNLTAGDALIDSPRVPITTATLYSSNAYISAVFRKDLKKITLTVSDTKGGKITPEGPFTLTPFESVELKAEAENNFLFTHWTIAGAGASYTMQQPSEETILLRPISGDITVTPHFEQLETPIDTTGDATLVVLNLSDDGHCTIRGALTRELKKGRRTTLRADVVPGYTFDHWEVVSGSVELESPDESYSRIKVNSTAHLKAHCKKLQQIKVRMLQSGGASKEFRINYIDVQ